MADENDLINQDEIERLLQGATNKPAAKPSAPPPLSAPPDDVRASADEIEAMLAQNSLGNPGTTASRPTQHSQTTAASEEDGGGLDQTSIDRMLGQAGKSGQVAAEPIRKPIPPTVANEGDLPQRDIELLLHQAERALTSINETPAPNPPGVAAFRLPEFAGAPPPQENATLDLVRDVELDLRIELGRTQMYLEDVLRLRRGSVVPLDKLAGDPVDVYVNGRLIAKGEVLVLNNNFCVRVAQLIAGAGRHRVILPDIETLQTTFRGLSRAWMPSFLRILAILVVLAGSARSAESEPFPDDRSPRIAEPRGNDPQFNEQPRPAAGSSHPLPPSNHPAREVLPGKAGFHAALPSLAGVGSSLAVVLGLFFVVAWLLRKATPGDCPVLPKEAIEVLGRADPIRPPASPPDSAGEQAGARVRDAGGRRGPERGHRSGGSRSSRRPLPPISPQ